MFQFLSDFYGKMLFDFPLGTLIVVAVTIGLCTVLRFALHTLYVLLIVETAVGGIVIRREYIPAEEYTELQPTQNGGLEPVSISDPAYFKINYELYSKNKDQGWIDVPEEAEEKFRVGTVVIVSSKRGRFNGVLYSKTISLVNDETPA